jgi:hypothetical protein
MMTNQRIHGPQPLSLSLHHNGEIITVGPLVLLLSRRLTDAWVERRRGFEPKLKKVDPPLQMLLLHMGINYTIKGRNTNLN